MQQSQCSTAAFRSKPQEAKLTLVAVGIFSFGVGADIASNRILADIGRQTGIENSASIYAQSRQFMEIQDPPFVLRRIDEAPGKPAPTLRVARQFVEFAIEDRINLLYLAAAAPHLPRAIRDTWEVLAEKKFEHSITLAGCARIHDVPFENWFCMNSEQPHTRTSREWFKRERRLMHTPFWIYKLIAS